MATAWAAFSMNESTFHVWTVISRASFSPLNMFGASMPIPVPMDICCCIICVSSKVFSPKIRDSTPCIPNKFKKYHDSEEMYVTS